MECCGGEDVGGRGQVCALWLPSPAVLSCLPLLLLLSLRPWLSDLTSLPSLSFPFLKNGQSQSSPPHSIAVLIK